MADTLYFQERNIWFLQYSAWLYLSQKKNSTAMAVTFDHDHRIDPCVVSTFNNVYMPHINSYFLYQALQQLKWPI